MLKIKSLLFVMLGILISLQGISQSIFDAKQAKEPKTVPVSGQGAISPEGLIYWNQLLKNKNPEQRNFGTFDIGKIKPVEVNKALQNSWKVDVIDGDMTYFAHPYSKNKVSIDVSNDRKISDAVFNFLENNASVINIKNPADAFDIRTILSDKNENVHIRLDQKYKGLKIYASDIVVHLNENGVYCFNGRYHKDPELDSTVPVLSAAMAEELMKSDLSLFTKVIDYPDNEIVSNLVAHPLPESELQIYFDKEEKPHLIWMIAFSPNLKEHWHYMIDANTGEILKKLNNVCNLGPETTTATDLYGNSRTLNTWREGNTYYFVDGSRPNFNPANSQMPDDPAGGIVTLNLNNNPVDQFGSWVNNLAHIQSNNNNFNNPTAVSAHYNAGKCYDYYKNTFNRNAIDGNGGTIWSVINVSDDSGGNFDNAFWNGSAMFYGNGNQVFNELPKALDVAAHEMSHGVTQNTANLIYQGQSGALNESFSDVFGSMVDRNDWKMGEDITNPNVISSGTLRDLQNPNNGTTSGGNGWQPASMSEYVNTNQDNGGVHINSGIPNRAFYLFATAVGKETAEQVYYHALNNYLTQNSQFVDCRASVLQSCLDLYDTATRDAASSAFDQVGIFGQGSVGTPSGGNSATSGGDLPPISGQEYMVVADYQVQSNTATHYKISIDPFAILSQVSLAEAYPKISITDDGTLAAFVQSDNNIYLADLTSADPSGNLNQVSTTGNWRKVAISRDGAFIAALSTANDNQLFIFKSDNTSQTYSLYNPSTAGDGSIGGAPDYADAIQFSHSGEYLMYDAKNTISSTGNPVEFWDIGLIKVRNLDDDSFGDGNIQKVFPPQPTNISIGNPSYSNNSPYIICYDFLDANTGQEFIAAANLETGETNVVAETNSVIGYPTYSPQDDAIAFSNNDNFDYTVEFVEVGSDKITATSFIQGLLNEAAWPVWYTQGQRNWQTPTAEFTSNVVQGPASLTVNFADASTNSPTQWAWTFEQGNPATSSLTNPIITFDTPGMYEVSLTVSNPSGSATETKANYITVGEATAIEIFESDDYFINAHPNPSTDQTTIKFNIPRKEKIDLVLFDITGKTIKTLIDNKKTEGLNEVFLNTTDLEKGIYFVRIVLENRFISHKLMVQ